MTKLHVINEAPPPSLVEKLEDLLALAKAGKMSGFVCLFTAEGSIGFVEDFATHERLRYVGMVELWKQKIIDSFDALIDDEEDKA